MPQPMRVVTKLKIAAAFIFALGASVTPLHAQYSAAYDTCVRAAGNDSTNLTVCAQTELNRQDARLNQLYRKRMTQLSSDAASTTSLRADERKWIRARDQKCKTASDCLLKETHDRADFLAGQLSPASASPSPGASAAIPPQLVGRWTVTKTLPTKTISCWGEAEAALVINSEIIYTADSFQWKGATVTNPKVTTATVSAKEFELNNSGGGANDSNVSFKQLGIPSGRATQITIDHPDSTSADGTSEIPGDSVLLRDPTHIVFSVCNLYFLATKKP